GNLAPGIHTLSRLQDVADDDLVHPVSVETRSGQDLGDDRGAELDRGRVLELAAKRSNSCAKWGRDDNVVTVRTGSHIQMVRPGGPCCKGSRRRSYRSVTVGRRGLIRLRRLGSERARR